MTIRPLVYVASASLISGCAGNMTFSSSNLFGGESLELRRDGTFEYSSSSDVIGDECTAQGSWRREESTNSIQYVVLDVEKRNQAEDGTDKCTRVTEHRYWLISHGGILSVNDRLIPRK